MLVFSCDLAARDLHSFPTRRSSDLCSWYGLVVGICPRNTCLSTASRFRAASSTSVSTSTGTAGSCSSKGSARTSISRSEEHTSELQSLRHLVCRLLLEKKKSQQIYEKKRKILVGDLRKKRRVIERGEKDVSTAVMKGERKKK